MDTVMTTEQRRKDRRRAVDHYTDQARIAELEQALRRWQQHFDQGDFGRHVSNALAFDKTLADTSAALKVSA